MRPDRTPLLLAAILAAVVLGGLALPQWLLFIFTIACAQGLVVLGLSLLIRAGLVSFGQALFYCVGAYTAGGLSRAFGVSDLFVQMAAGTASAALFAFVLGFLLSRYRGIFFGLLSLALSMIFYGLIVKSESLGSTDGFNLAKATLFGARPSAAWVRYSVLVAAACFTMAAAFLTHRFLKTPLGQLARAIKDNEIRVEYMGASVRYAIHVNYVIAAALAGAGGALAATTVGHIDPEMSYWTTSGEFVFIAILSGSGSVVAPFLGALIFGAVRSVAFDLSPNTWQMSMGLALLAAIVFLPDGLWSLFRRRRAA